MLVDAAGVPGGIVMSERRKDHCMVAVAGLPYEDLDPPALAAHLDEVRRERQ